jgi:flagellar protein FlaJ
MDKDSLKEGISKAKKTVDEITSLFKHLKNTDNSREKNLISSHIEDLRTSLRKTSGIISESLGGVSIAKPLGVKKLEIEKKEPPIFQEKQKKTIMRKGSISKDILSNLERETLRRLKKKEEKVVEVKEKKPSAYIKTANRFFSDLSMSLLKKKKFQKLEKDLVKTNLQFTSISYVSIILFTTFLSTIIGLLLFLFFFFFNVSATLPIITRATENVGLRFLKVFWILFAIPMGTFVLIYFYPSLEKKSGGAQIDHELPFATIHMSAIAGSMLEPSKIFNIIISTKEYPYLEKEFIKIINEIKLYGYDLVTALRHIAMNSPSKKFADLINSLATTITSGGDLPTFFEKRAQSLLFEHKLGMEKYTKTSETFMDIYISVVIAAPMILMLLLMMMKISGLGISMSTGMITLVMVLGVSVVNVIFLTFLQLRKPGG